MTLRIAILLTLLTTTAHAEQWCISRTGRLRLRPAACFVTERAYTPGGAKSLAVVDRDGDLVGPVMVTGYDLVDRPVLVFRLVGAESLALPVGRDGLFGPGTHAALFYVAPDCTGTPRVPDFGDQNGLVKVGPVWPDRMWYPVGASHPAPDGASYLLPPSTAFTNYNCAANGGTERDGGFCCITYPAVADAWFEVASFAPTDAGLEPPFRLSVEP